MCVTAGQVILSAIIKSGMGCKDPGLLWSLKKLQFFFKW
jgi:hypothetical protein